MICNVNKQNIISIKYNEYTPSVTISSAGKQSNKNK